jgi:hypothetical protein
MMNKFLLVVFVLMCVMGCQMLNPKKDDYVDIATIQKDYMDSKEAARTKYDGKQVLTMGTVRTASPDEDAPRFRLYDQTRSELISATELTCVVDKSDAALFSQVKEKELLKVKGTLSVRDDTLELRSCKRVPLGE